MGVRVDQQANALYVNLTDHEIAGSEEVADGIVVDYDVEGRIVGIESSMRRARPAIRWY